VTSSEITTREPHQNPVLVFSITLTQKRVRPPVWIILVLLVFSITLTQKRVRPPVWIILVLHAELASVRSFRQRPLSLQPPIHSRICVRCAFPVADDYVTAKQTLQSPKSKVACTHTNKNQKMQMQILTNTYRRRAHANTHTHTQTPTQMLNFVSVRTIKGSSSTHAHDTFRFLS